MKKCGMTTPATRFLQLSVWGSPKLTDSGRVDVSVFVLEFDLKKNTVTFPNGNTWSLTSLADVVNRALREQDRWRCDRGNLDDIHENT